MVLADQRRTGLRFGDSAVRLRLVQPEDIRRALAAQFRYPFLSAGEHSVSKEVIAAYDPFTPQVEVLRGIRAQIMLRTLEVARQEKAIAVVSAGRHEGRSWLTANLAVVFAQLGERTLVIDADLRNPRQDALFGIENREGLSSVLAGRCSYEHAVQRVPGLNLSVLTAGPIPPNPQELLLGPALLPLLATADRDFDMVLVDTPAALNADAYTLGARIGAAILLTHRHQSRLVPVRRLTETLEQSGCVMLGAVMNSTR
ncbi:MAG: polysaccharide biosynthesis tyrosine autokinase [Pseudomonadota bacterium]|nr:polysaccharide biosynthesis tyrosine autokinase [Pseudomonadota bacterium]